MRVYTLVLVGSVTLGAAFCGGCLARSAARDKPGSIEVDGEKRTFVVHFPARFDGGKPVPLVLILHGRSGTGPGQQRLSHFDEVSDEHGFIAVYPNGFGNSWADGRGITPSEENQIDDVKFLSQLIDMLSKKIKLDPNRIYAAGMSNGGFMSARLGCDLSDKIAAVAVVGASLSNKTAAACKPARPVSILIMQGTKDPLVPFGGGAMGKNGDHGEVLSHEETIRTWVKLDQCPGTPHKRQIADAAKDGTSVDVTVYSPCAKGTEVQGYAIIGGGHTWPGGRKYLPEVLIGKTSGNVNASEVIWEFFSRHAR